MRARLLAVTPAPAEAPQASVSAPHNPGAGGKDLCISASSCTDSIMDCLVISWLVPMSPAVWLD